MEIQKNAEQIGIVQLEISLSLSLSICLSLYLCSLYSSPYQSLFYTYKLCMAIKVKFSRFSLLPTLPLASS